MNRTASIAALVLALVSAGLAGITLRNVQRVEAKIDALEPPYDSLALEIERLEKRLSSLERKANKAAKTTKPTKSKKSPATAQ